MGRVIPHDRYLQRLAKRKFVFDFLALSFLAPDRNPKSSRGGSSHEIRNDDDAADILSIIFIIIINNIITTVTEVLYIKKKNIVTFLRRAR